MGEGGKIKKKKRRPKNFFIESCQHPECFKSIGVNNNDDNNIVGK